VRVSTPRKVAVLARTLAGEAVDAARSRGGRGGTGAGARDGRDDGGAA
jgi:15-cis-phytoene synthase